MKSKVFKQLTKAVSFLLLLSGLTANAQDLGVSNVVLVEGTLNTSISSVTYELCPTSSASLEIVIENFSTDADTVSKVTLSVTGVNARAIQEYTLTAGPTAVAASSSITVTFPDDFVGPLADLSFLNDGLSTITVSTTSVSGTGDLDTDNDAFYIVGKVFNPDIPSLSSVQDGAACQGEEISFSISPSTGQEYKFYVNGALAYQGSNTTITFSSDPADVDALSNGDVITIGFIDTNGCEVDTSTISKTVEVYSLPTAELNAGDAPEAVCEGESVTFTASGGTEYAFYKAGVLVQARSVSNTYTTTGLSNTQSVTVTVYNANGCEDQATIVMDVLSITSAGSITFTDAADASVCYGSAPAGTLSSTADAVVSHDLSYQWQSSANGVDWSDIDGETGENYSPPQLFQTTYFRRLASVSSNTLSCEDNGASNVLTITVNEAFALSLTTAEAIYCMGESIHFAATAGAVSYTFLINGTTAQTSSTENLFATVSTSTSVASLTVKNNDVITVIAEDANGCTVSETLTVVSSDTPLNPSLTPDIPGNILCLGESVAITAGGGASYAFTLDGLAPLAGEVSGNVLTTTRLTDGAIVEVTVTNAEGCTASTSMTFEVVSLTTAGTVTITVPAELEICYNTPLTAVLSSTQAATSSDSVYYQWQSSTDGASYVNISGENNENLDLSTLPNLTTTTYFKRNAFAYIDTNGNGQYDIGEIQCANGLETSPIMIDVDDNRVPLITSSTGSFSFCEDAAVTFTASGGSGGDTYTWEFTSGTTTTTSSGDITSAQTTNVTIVDSGSIKLTITTASGCSYEITENITLVAVPASTVTATATTVCEGDSVTLTAGPAGQATYTFKVGGVTKQSSDSRTYTATGLVTTTTFTVEVANALGCTDTTSITIYVPKLASAGTISITADDMILCAGETLGSDIDGDGTAGGSEATLSGSVGSIGYQWQISYDDGGSYEPMGVTTADLTSADLGTISQTIYVQRLAYVLNDGVECVNQPSNAIKIALEDTRTPIVQFEGAAITTLSVCASEDIQLSASGALAGTDTYTWYVNGTAQASGTAILNLSAGSFATGNIILEIETEEGCLFDTTIPVSVVADPVIELTSDALLPHIICKEDSITFSVTEVASATYYWTKYSTTTPTAVALGGSPTSTNSLTVSGLTLSDGDIITVTVSYTGACSVTDSITVNVIDLDPGTFDVTPPVVEVCSGDIPSTLTNVSSATATNGVVSITYDWEYSTDNGNSWNSTGINSTSLVFGGTLPETRIYRRVAIASWAGLELCRAPTLLDQEIRVRDPEGGTFPVTTETVCYNFGANASEIVVTGAATGTYQWQSSTDGTTFANIDGETNPTYTPSITSTETLYFRRITYSTATCSDTTDNIYTLRVSDLEPGSLSTDPTAVYCYGAQPPMLGVGSSEDATSSLGPVTYIWKSKIDGTPGPFTVITGANSRNYQPPPLLASPTNETTSYLYQRIAVDASGCESIPTNTVTITIAPFIDPGDLGFKNVAPLNYYICSGQEEPDDLVLRNATLPSAGVVTYTWEQSTDEITWSSVPSTTSNAQLTFGTSNTPTETTYYRVRITSGSGTPSTATSTLALVLAETGNNISYGEQYDVYIAGTNVQVITSAAVSTTDLIGEQLANKITAEIPGYNATYFEDENIVIVDTYTSDVAVTRQTNGTSSTLFLEIVPVLKDGADDYCTSYSNTLKVTVYEAPSITQIGGPFDSQTICVGDAVDPVTFEMDGSFDYLEITGISSPAFQVEAAGAGTATYSATTGSWFVTNTTQFTITGTPTLALDESLNIRMTTSGACRDEASTTYRIETVNGPDTPDIIYRNVAPQGRGLEQRFQIFEYDGTWFNNTVCQDDGDVPPDNDPVVYEFAACYNNNSSLRDVVFDWEIEPAAAVSSITFKNDGNTRMVADVTVNDIAGTTTFTAGEVYTITITGPGNSTHSIDFTTTAVQFDDLVDDLETAFDALNFVYVDQADRDGDGTAETLVFTADTALEAGYFRLSIQNPDNAEFLLESPVYQYPLKDNVIQVIFNPDFGTTTGTTGGVTATLKVRAESAECTDVFSDWYEVELFIVEENNPVSALPELREPIVFNTIDVCGGNSYNVIPTCELNSTEGWDTIFYSAPTATSSYTYNYLEWKIDNIAAGSPDVDYPGRNYQWNGGIDPEYGIVSWAPGFYGQFDVCVRPIACDGSTDTNGDLIDDELGWVCRTITINPLEALPNIFASDLPLCPIPASGLVTSTFTSDLDVTWSVQPAAAIASTSTITVAGRDALQVVWRNNFSGTAWVTAENTSCSGGNVRNFTVRIPDDPVLTRTSTVTSEAVCQGEAITPINFSLNGYSVIGIDDSELPEGLTANYTADVQSATFNITRRTYNPPTNALTYIISIDYVDYTLVATNTASIAEITADLVDLIATAPQVGSVTSTTYITSSTIEILGADPGVRFNIATNASRSAAFNLSQPAISTRTGAVEVTGSISETLTTASPSYFGVGPDGVSQDHRFYLYTISSSASCTSEIGEIQLFYSPNHSITTVTSTLLNQEICDGDVLDTIRFDLSGGARDYETIIWSPEAPTGLELSPLPGDVIGSATPSFTLGGTLSTNVVTTTVYYYTITTTGTLCDTDTITGTIVVHPNRASDRLDPQQGDLSACDGSYVELFYEFEGIPGLTVTTTSTLASLGLTASNSYTSTPSVELTVVSSATQIGEIFQVEIVEEDGGARSYRYVSITGAESATAIASALASRLDTDPEVSASSSGTVITVESIDLSYVFWTRINRAGVTGTIDHYNDAKIRVTDATAVKGVYSLTGTLTLGISST
ncbi:MAG: hypothetical protein ACON4A_06805, partial [Flavobacteriaceae bacterium]